jgi:hypothetical protein
MGKHYLATRKPQRIQRIRKKVESMIEHGVPFDRIDQKWGGFSMPLLSLLNRVDKLGYAVLCEIEMILELVEHNYNRAMSEAVSQIAYLVGRGNISLEDLIKMASDICPPPTASEIETRGVNAEKTLDDYRKYRESPFQFLRYPSTLSGTYYEWRFLHRLSLAQLELLTVRLQNLHMAHTSTIVRFEPMKQ